MFMPMSDALKTLAIDTSTSRGSVALLEGRELRGEIRLSSPQTHSARLLRSMEFLLDSVGWDLGQVDLFAACRGPGSFTGIRIGMATGLGLAQTLRRPFAAISGLDALAWAVPLSHVRIGVVMDAQRSQVYYAEYFKRGRQIR